MTSRPRETVPFLAGLLTAACVFALFGGFVAYKIGFSRIVGRLERAISFSDVIEPVVELPEPLLDELRRVGAVIDNAQVVTQPLEDSFLIRSDDRLGFVLRPDVKVSAYMLRALNPLNLDPAVIYMKPATPLSDAMRAYLDANTRLAYEFSTDMDGFRSTLPIVQSSSRILIVGDSVAFGVGVRDSSTIASALQKRLGEAYAITNAGVGNYSGPQAFEMASLQSEHGKYAALIYIACQNDFMTEQGVRFLDQARPILEQFERLEEKFPAKIIVMLVTYMEYELNDILLEHGWPRGTIEEVDELRRGVREISAERGYEFVDWSDIAARQTASQGSIFSRFALYSDHAHLSPLGSSLAAEALDGALQRVNVVSTGRAPVR